MSPARWNGFHQSGLPKAEVPMLVTDDEVIEQWQVEIVVEGVVAVRGVETDLNVIRSRLAWFRIP